MCVRVLPSDVNFEGDHKRDKREENSTSEAATSGKSPSMTAPSHGAAAEGEADPLWEAPLSPGEVCPGLFREDPPRVSEQSAARALRDHAVDHPETIRSFIKSKAEELAEAVCDHDLPLVTWQQDPTATTCGRYQSGVLAAVSLQVGADSIAVCDRHGCDVTCVTAPTRTDRLR